ncbi:MAG: hypothetical protein K2F59_03360 [Eubacteriales bacterium]|nr:hypothetical protein [Eubacteriales bacterium]
MNTLNSLINVMLGLITTGISFRIASHLFALIFNVEEKETYIKKIKNCLIAFVVSTSIFSIKLIIEHYFK